MHPFAVTDLSRTARRLWLVLAALFLAVQLALPAHQASHPIGEPDNACHYCMLGGHSPGMPNATLPPQASESRAQAPRVPAETPASQSFARTHFSRGPPHSVGI